MDCSVCSVSECRSGGCRITGEPMLSACVFCGEITMYSLRMTMVCIGCGEGPADGGLAPTRRGRPAGTPG